VDIDRDTIRRLERLSRLELSDDEAERITTDLARIVAFVDVMRSVDTEGVTPTRVTSRGALPGGRADGPAPGLGRDEVLSRAPDRVRGFFRVPRAIGGGEDGDGRG
jgi:aspartyl-tRNA(Asn)/glutamyl-tRNA(Gln) amidotransferase subunit C